MEFGLFLDSKRAFDSMAATRCYSLYAIFAEHTAAVFDKIAIALINHIKSKYVLKHEQETGRFPKTLIKKAFFMVERI